MDKRAIVEPWLDTSAPHPDSPEDGSGAIVALIRAVECAERDPARAGRLRGAATSVTITLSDQPQAGSVSIYFEDAGIRTELGSGANTEAEFSVPAEVLLAFSRGEAWLPTAILAGVASYRGPIRKFLRVAPIIAGVNSHPEADR